MKILLFLLAICAFENKGYSQTDTFIVKDGLLTIEMIDSALSVKKGDAYNIAKEWIAKNFGSAKAVIDLDNQEKGTLIIKYNFDTNTIDTGKNGTPIVLAFHNKATMQIDCRDNKVRVRVNAFQCAVDASHIIADFVGKYEPIEKMFERSNKNGDSLETFSKRKIYQQLILDTKVLNYSLFNAIEEGANDKF